MVQVELVNEREANLLGLILRGLLERNLEGRDTPAWCRRRGRTIHVQAGQMQATVGFGPEGIRIGRGLEGSANATVRGTLKAFLKVATRQSLVKPVLQGAIRIRGNPFLLLKVLPLLRA